MPREAVIHQALSKVSSYAELAETLGLAGELPYTPKWSAAPDFLALMADWVLKHKPTNIVECSSGLSTLILARCCQLNGKGTVLSLENGEQYAQSTRLHLQAYGLDNLAQVAHAPLVHHELGDERYQWYQLDGLGLPDEVDLLVIDGPPAFLQPLARYPALPLLQARFAADMVILLDDAARAGEREIVARWLQQMPELSHQYHDTERGCSVLIKEPK